MSHPSKVVWTKIAPGMTYQLTISFYGDEIKDYEHQIMFKTGEEEQFKIPIFGKIKNKTFHYLINLKQLSALDT